MHGLPKSVANVSSQFHHLVDTGLTVGSLVRWLPIKVAHTCKLGTIWVVYCSTLELAPSDCNCLNTLRLRQNGRHFTDYSLKCIFFNENVWIPTKISLKFVPKGPIDIIPALVQIMAWRRPGDKPLSEPMMVVLPTHICVTRPQWVNALHTVEFYIQWCEALHRPHWGSYFEKLIYPCINFVKKLAQLVALQIFQSSYLSWGITEP